MSVTTVLHNEPEEQMCGDSAAVSELVKDMQSKHLAEKRVLEMDIQAYRAVIKRLIFKFTVLKRQKQKSDIELGLMRKV